MGEDPLRLFMSEILNACELRKVIFVQSKWLKKVEMFCATRNDKRNSNVIFEGRFLSVYCSINPIHDSTFHLLWVIHQKFTLLFRLTLPTSLGNIIEIYFSHNVGSVLSAITSLGDSAKVFVSLGFFRGIRTLDVSDIYLCWSFWNHVIFRAKDSVTHDFVWETRVGFLGNRKRVTCFLDVS